MSKLKTLNTSIKVNKSAETKEFQMNFSFQHEEGKAPDMINCKAISKATEDPKLRVDVTYYPEHKNLHISCNNIPEAFNAQVINEALVYLKEIAAEFAG